MLFSANEVRRQLEMAKAQAYETAVETAHKDYVGQSHRREVERLQALLELLEAGANVVGCAGGYAILRKGRRMYRYALASGRWNSAIIPNDGLVKWGGLTFYRSKSPQHFIDNFVNRTCCRGELA